MSELPPPHLPEFALLGRSNSGKSSLINLMVQRKIAKVSSLPGRTSALQVFEIKGLLRLIDAPGYGWASRSHDELADWQILMETYLTQRESLSACLLIQDVRRDWEDLDEMQARYFFQHSIPWIWILNKLDQMKTSEFRTRERTLRTFFEKHLRPRGCEEVYFLGEESPLSQHPSLEKSLIQRARSSKVKSL